MNTHYSLPDSVSVFKSSAASFLFRFGFVLLVCTPDLTRYFLLLAAAGSFSCFLSSTSAFTLSPTVAFAFTLALSFAFALSLALTSTLSLAFASALAFTISTRASYKRKHHTSLAADSTDFIHIETPESFNASPALWGKPGLLQADSPLSSALHVRMVTSPVVTPADGATSTAARAQLRKGEHSLLYDTSVPLEALTLVVRQRTCHQNMHHIV